jgi:hypothetical protein
MQGQQPTPRKWLIRTVEWIAGIVCVALIVAGFVLTNLPKLSVNVSGSSHPNDLMGTVFSVSNEGFFPVYDVNVGCEVMRVDIPPPRNTHVVGPTTVYFPESRAENLSPGHKMTVPCGRAIGIQLANAEVREIHAEMFIVVTYRPKWLRSYKSEKFPMATEKTENGTWRWKSIPR